MNDVYYTIKIDNKKYYIRIINNLYEINTEIGWLSVDKFVDYLFVNEKINQVRDLATIGLDRLINA